VKATPFRKERSSSPIERVDFVNLSDAIALAFAIAQASHSMNIFNNLMVN